MEIARSRMVCMALKMGGDGRCYGVYGRNG